MTADIIPNPPWLTLKPNTSCLTLKYAILSLFLMYQILWPLSFLLKHHLKLSYFTLIVQPHARNPCRTLISQHHACSSDSNLLHHSLTPETLFSVWNPSILIPTSSRFDLNSQNSCLSLIPYSILQRQFRLHIPFLEIARPQPQFPHSCVCERFIYSQDRSTYVFPPAEKADPSHRGNI